MLWCLFSRKSQRDVFYLGWPIAPSYMSPNAGEWRGLSQWIQLCTWSPNKQWRSNSIFPPGGFPHLIGKYFFFTQGFNFLVRKVHFQVKKRRMQGFRFRRAQKKWLFDQGFRLFGPGIHRTPRLTLPYSYRVRPPPPVGPVATATGGISKSILPDTGCYIIGNKGISELLGCPGKGNEELWGPQRPNWLLTGPLLWAGGWGY